MPQEIPLEASETLVFTPASLASIEGAPTFTLRAATTREKRFRRRLLSEEGVAFHSEADLRAEIIHALKTKLWGEEKFASHGETLLSYWEALDNFKLQQKQEPDLVWTYDAEVERAVFDLLRDVEQAWKPLGRMKADNIDFNELFLAATVAVVVEDWDGIEAAKHTDRGFLTLDCVDGLAIKLAKFAQRHADPDNTQGVAGKLAWMELVNACSNRMSLDEDEEKNSESPSPSEMTQPASSETKASEPAGKSPASARSKKTRENA